MMTLRLRLVATMGLLASIPSVGQPIDRNESLRAAERVAHDPFFKSVDYGREQIHDVSAVQLIDVEYRKLPRRVLGPMYTWCEAVFKPAVNPHTLGRPLEPGRMAVRAYAAYGAAQDDLIEYRWRHEGQNLRVLASRNAMRLEIDMDELARDSRLAHFEERDVNRLRQWLGEVLRLEGKDVWDSEYRIEFTWPEALLDSTVFSSNPDQDLNRLTRWHQRVDIFVVGRTMNLLIYKKPDQLLHFQDGSTWFTEDFRRLVHERSRELDIEPKNSDPGEP